MTVIDEFEEEFKKFTGVKHAIAVCNGTAALITAMMAIDLKQGEKVITTPFTFIATSNCILHQGGLPIFADIDRETYCIDPRKVELGLVRNPFDMKAIICVHLFGKVCDVEALAKLAKKYNVWFIEDCAQALGARHKGIHVGNFGDIGCFSFYASKNLSTFEGGMVVTNNDTLAKKIRMIINHGSDIKYRHEILGYNFRMPQVCALIGLTQLKLHKVGIMAELGSYGLENGYYPEVIYNQPLYRKLGIIGDCPISEDLAKRVRKKVQST